MIVCRAGPGVKLTKVLGHAKPEDVTKGATSAEDKEGNDAADALAVAAAMAHAPPQHLVDEAHERQATTTAMQNMMLRILHVRFESEHCDEDNSAYDAFSPCVFDLLSPSGTLNSEYNEESRQSCQHLGDAEFENLPVEIEPG